MVVYHASFPSGHAMTAASVYLTLGVLLARLQQRRYQAILIMGTAILVTVLVGVSRVYLAVHWPSDVLAGWTAGSIWATACWLAAWKLRQIRHARNGNRKDDAMRAMAGEPEAGNSTAEYPAEGQSANKDNNEDNNKDYRE
jgi:membrane-associated phospholipid phosphatase